MKIKAACEMCSPVVVVRNFWAYGILWKCHQLIGIREVA